MKKLTLLNALAVVCAGGGLATTRAAEAPRTATFEARQEFKVTVPQEAKKLRLWCALPQEDGASQISDLKIESPFNYSIEKDAAGNRVLYIEVENPAIKEFTVVETFKITRSEIRSAAAASKAGFLSDDDRRKMADELAANANVPLNDDIRALANHIVGDEKNPVLAARKIYDWTLDNIEYWVKDPKHKKASAVGSAEYCLASKTGNCTDFHSLWAALARASGIPTRIVYGSFFKKDLDGKDADQSYHCWIEFYAPNIGWIPHDVAVADIFYGDYPVNDDNAELIRLTTADGYSGPDRSKVDYYFGNIDERRVVWSVGRDLTLSPRQDCGPVNALPKAYMEVDGKVCPEKTGWTRKLTFREIK
jgi:transglutaminase-like putative cysteine protease